MVAYAKQRAPEQQQPILDRDTDRVWYPMTPFEAELETENLRHEFATEQETRFDIRFVGGLDWRLYAVWAT